MSSATEGNTPSTNWFKDIYRQLHMDAHFNEFKEVYKGFDAEATAQTLKDIGFQMVSYMAQDGYCHYPTAIGETHPGLAVDFVGEFTRALKKRGIRTIVYVRARSGKEICNMPDTDTFLIPIYTEILEKYDVDGFFVDGIFHPYFMHPCTCDACRALFSEEVGGDMPEEDDHPKAFVYRKWVNRRMDECIDKLWHALSAIKPDVAFLFNHTWHTRHPITPPPYIMHVCWDTPVPLEGLYAWNFSFEARYHATLNDIRPDLTFACQNVSSNDWVDYEVRETESFIQECAILLAACARTYPAHNPYPSGNTPPVLIEAYKAVNKRTQELEPYLIGCTPVKDVAILNGEDSVWSKAPIVPHKSWPPSAAYQSVAGAHKALIEGHVQVLIPNSEVLLRTIHDYNLLVLAHQPVLSAQEAEEIRRFVYNGGALIATYNTGTKDSKNNPLDDFSIADVLGVRYLASSDTENGYLRTTEHNEEYGIPAMDIPVVGPYARIETTTAETLLDLVPPYEGIKTGTPPPAVLSEGSGVTINTYGKGKVAYCAVPLFSAYYGQNTPVLRKLALCILGHVYPAESRKIVLENTPISVEVFYNQRGTERFVHLINYSGDKGEGGRPQPQDFVTVHGIRVRVRLEGSPVRVTRVPAGEAVPFAQQDGWISFDAAPLRIHEVYRIETAEE